MKLKKKKLKLSSVIALNHEINGYKNGEIFLPPILENRLNIKVKYWLGKFSKVAESEHKAYEEARAELIKKYGEEKEGGFSISPMISDPEFKPKKGSKEKAPMVPNPKLEEFRKEERELLEVEIEIDVPEFTLEELDFESEYIYRNIEENMIEE